MLLIGFINTGQHDGPCDMRVQTLWLLVEGIVWLWPLWWVLGVDALAIEGGMLALLMLFVWGLGGKKTLGLNISLLALVASWFWLWQLVAALQIGDLGRWMAFLPRWLGWFILICFLILHQNIRETARALFERILRALFWGLVLQSSVALLAEFLFLGTDVVFRFKAPLGNLLLKAFPSYAHDAYVQALLAQRFLGRVANNPIGSGKFLRLVGFFYYPTLYAAFLVLLYPYSKRIKKRFLRWVVQMLLVLALVFAASRTGLVMFAILWTIDHFVALWTKAKSKDRWLIGAFVGGGSLLLLLALGLALFSSAYIREVVDHFIIYRAQERFVVYIESAKLLLRSPLWGYGRPFDPNPNDFVPAYGTHSAYLNIAFSFGLGGLVLWMGVYGIAGLKIIFSGQIKPNTGLTHSTWALLGFAGIALTTIISSHFLLFLTPWLIWLSDNEFARPWRLISVQRRGDNAKR